MEIVGDFTTTLCDAMEEIDKRWSSYDGLIIAGTHTPKNIEGAISAIDVAYRDKVPFLGVCHGYQLWHIWYARTFLGITDATSEEYGVAGTPVITKRSEGMVCGEGPDGESYWTRYDIDPVVFEFINPIPGMFVYPFHPEYNSRKSKPHPALVNFLRICQ